MRIGAVSPDIGTIPAGPAAPAKGGSFEDALGQALGSLEETQRQADSESARLALGAGNLHETALALEKADVSMRVAMKVRNKVVDAYQDILRMSI